VSVVTVSCGWPPGSAGGTATPRSVRVVVVDDDPDMRLLVQIAVARTDGVELVGEADNGRAAVELVRKVQPDVVVLDLNLPIMSGLEALPILLQAAPAVGVVVFSATEHAQRDALAGGAVAYVSKTQPIADLIAAIARAAR
jgi:DNA-binding NarL/FixJ family response regulator